ncbi:MAG: MFS transporter, partial [Pseudomonadales bacterium]|nr:MFS transporter [Pseudomonadales bacterium]
MIKRPPENPIDKISVYIAAGLISGCGALMFNVMPAFVGAMAQTLAYDESELGDIVAAFNIGFTAVALCAVFWVRKINWRIAAMLAIILAVAGLLAMSLTVKYTTILLLMATVGIAMGGLYALVMAILGDSDNPDRAFGLKLGLETLPGAALLFLMPALIVPVAGFSGALYVMAVTLILLGIASFFLPSRGVKGRELKTVTNPNQHKNGSAILPLLGLTASLVFFTGITASWAFLELLGAAKGLPHESIGSVLAIAFVICGIGGFVAAALGDRYGRQLPLIVIIVINCTGLFLLGTFTEIEEYAVGASLFLFSVNFTLAYTFGLTAEVDVGGRLVVLSAAGLSIGAIIGPAAAGPLL